MKTVLHLVLAGDLRPGYLIQYDGKWREITRITRNKTTNVISIHIYGRTFYSHVDKRHKVFKQ